MNKLLFIFMFFITSVKADNVEKFIDVCMANHRELANVLEEDWTQTCECNAYLAKNIFTEDEYKNLISAMKENSKTPKLISFFGSMNKEKSERYNVGLKSCLSEFAPVKSLMVANATNCNEKGQSKEKCFCIEKGLLEIVGDKNYRKLRTGEFQKEVADYSNETILAINKMIDSCH